MTLLFLPELPIRARQGKVCALKVTPRQASVLLGRALGGEGLGLL